MRTDIRLTSAEKKAFVELVSRDMFLIVIHRNPDGDALGTCFALKRLLENMGKKVTVACSTYVPERLRFISDGASVFDPEFMPNTVIAVDLATEKLFGDKYAEYASKTDFCIDHHPTNTHYASNTILLGGASSAGEVLYKLIKACGFEIDRYIAEKLYTAISSDTGCFKYSSVTPAVHLIAAALQKFDIPCAEINRLLFDVSDFAHIKLDGMACAAVEVCCNGELALVRVSRKMLDEAGVDENDADGIISIPRKVAGIKVAAVLREMSDGTVRMSLRSEDNDTNVSAIAAEFGGGGHVKAAGCSFSGSLDGAYEALTCAVERYGKKQK